MQKVKILWVVFNDYGNHYEAENIKQMHHRQTRRNIPKFMLPRTVVKSNDTEKYVHLFQSVAAPNNFNTGAGREIYRCVVQMIRNADPREYAHHAGSYPLSHLVEWRRNIKAEKGNKSIRLLANNSKFPKEMTARQYQQKINNAVYRLQFCPKIF